MYTLLFIILAFLAFFWFIVFGRTLIYSDDAYFQHYSFLVKLRRFVSDIVHGNGVSLWSWDTGYGSDVIGNFAFVFCDPFAYIAAAFKPKYIDIGYTISVILRLYAAGVTMITFLRYRRKTGFQSLLGGIAYAFSSWAIISCRRHAFFLNPLILFPLLILGVDRIDKEKKPFIFVLTVFLSLITSFYFSYMSALLVIVYIVIKYFFESENRKSFKDFTKRFFSFVFYAIIAVMISAPILVPVFYSLINANRSSGVDLNAFLKLKEVFKYIPSYISNTDINGNYSYTSLTMICIAMVPAMIIDFKKGLNRFPTLMAFLCVIMAAFPFFGSVFNAMSYSVGRWCYMLAFFLIWASVSALDFEKFKDAEYKKSYKIVFSVMLLIFSVFLVLAKIILNVFPDKNLYSALINIIFLMIFVCVICSSEKNQKLSKTTLILAFTVVNLGLVYLIDLAPNFSDELSKYNVVGNTYKQYTGSAQRVGKQIEDDDFYRIDQVENSTPTGYAIYTHTPSNEAIFFGTRSVYSYISTLDNRIFDYHKALCNSAGYYRRVCFCSNDNRSRMNFLQGVKYFIGNNKDKNLMISQYSGYGFKNYETIDGIDVLRNRYKASLGYVFNNKINESDFIKYDYLDREQIMMQACVVPDNNKTSVPEISKSDIDLDSHSIDYKIVSENGLRLSNGKIKVTSEHSRLTISTGEIKNSEVYVVFKNLKKKPLPYKEYKESVLSNRKNLDIESYKFDVEKISYYPHGNFNIYLNKPGITKRLINADGDNQGFVDVKDYIANLGYYKSTNGNITIDFKDIGDYTYDSIEVVAVSQKNFNDQAKTLEKNRLKVSTLNDNYIKGKVNAENDGMLYLSIPYTKGWKVYIDGKEQETYIADIAFTGVDIDKGEHTVELKYRPVGFKAELTVCWSGIVIFAVILVYQMLKRRKVSSVK